MGSAEVENLLDYIVGMADLVNNHLDVHRTTCERRWLLPLPKQEALGAHALRGEHVRTPDDIALLITIACAHEELFDLAFVDVVHHDQAGIFLAAKLTLVDACLLRRDVTLLAAKRTDIRRMRVIPLRLGACYHGETREQENNHYV
ncbi:MAG: hypothetical protein JWN49_62 [Parcubacteria group bacterium]|nr:hypothetical protein [Parcubacteria group bacterium]